MKYYYDTDGNCIRLPGLDEEHKRFLVSSATNYIRKYAYEHGDYIYKFMEKYNIGHTDYGKLMDAAGRGKGVMAHRLYGHHLIWDFPIDNIENINPFIEHLGSDIFTKQGLPIIPGEILEDVGLKKSCGDLTRNWNFVNGFDILSATIAIYSGYKHIKKYVVMDNEIKNIDELASTLGVGSLNLAIALSTANPFLFIGGVLSFVAGIKGVFNDGSRVYFDKNFRYLTVDYCIDSLDIKKVCEPFSLDITLHKHKINTEQYGINTNTNYFYKGCENMNDDAKTFIKIQVNELIDKYSVGFIQAFKKAIIDGEKDRSLWCKKDRDELNFALYNMLKTYNVSTVDFFKNADVLWELSTEKNKLDELIDIINSPESIDAKFDKYNDILKWNLRKLLRFVSVWEMIKLLKNSFDVSKFFDDYCMSLREYCYELIDKNG